MAATNANVGMNGLDFFPLSTGFFDDDKVFELVDGYDDPTEGYAAVARYMHLLCMIYDNEDGPALEVTQRRARMVAKRYFGMTVEALEDLVCRCVDAQLFDRQIWERCRVLTSRGIQRRWRQAKKRTGMPPATLQWSLIDDDGWQDVAAQPAADARGPEQPRVAPSSSEQPRVAPSSSEQPRVAPSSSEQPRVASPKEKKDKGKEKREEEDKYVPRSGQSGVFDNSAQSADASQLVPQCMAHEEYGRVFADSLDQPHRTRYGALEATYRARTGRGDFDGLMRRACELCPGGCRASPDDVSECFELMIGALERVDPGKGSPWALVRHVLVNDRGGRDAA